MQEEKQVRQIRSDKGKAQITERDQQILRWIAEQYAVRLDQLRELLSPSSGLISETRTRQIIKRWEQAGWVKIRKWLANEPAWIWTTGRGLSMLGLDEFKVHDPAVTRLRHIHAVNEVRAYVERSKKEPRREWKSERWLRVGKVMKKGVTLGPIPDGEVIFHYDDPVYVAIEVELTAKKRDDLVSKLRSLTFTEHYGTIWVFVATQAMKERVEEARGKIANWEKRIMVYIIEA